jgi:hypothetical protein
VTVGHNLLLFLTTSASETVRIRFSQAWFKCKVTCCILGAQVFCLCQRSNSRNPTEQHPSRGDNSLPASHEICRLLLSPKVHYRVHNNQSLDLTLSETNSLHKLESYSLLYILILYFHLNLVLPSGVLTFLNRNYSRSPLTRLLHDPS